MKQHRSKTYPPRAASRGRMIMLLTAELHLRLNDTARNLERHREISAAKENSASHKRETCRISPRARAIKITSGDLCAPREFHVRGAEHGAGKELCPRNAPYKHKDGRRAYFSFSGNVVKWPGAILKSCPREPLLKGDIYLARVAATAEPEHYGDEEKFSHFVLIRGGTADASSSFRVRYFRAKLKARLNTGLGNCSRVTSRSLAVCDKISRVRSRESDSIQPAFLTRFINTYMYIYVYTYAYNIPSHAFPSGCICRNIFIDFSSVIIQRHVSIRHF